MMIRRALALLCALAWVGPALAAPGITMTPASGPPTTALTVKGTGYPAGAVVDIYFDTGAKCLVLASGTGTWTCRFRADKQAQPGQHFITAVQRSTGTGLQKAFLVRTNWTHWQFDGSRAGFNPYENTISPENAHALTLKWRVPLAAPSWSQPIIANGRVYVVTKNGRLHARNATTGVKIDGFPKIITGWTATNWTTTPAFADGRIYVLDGAGRLHAFTEAGQIVSGYPIVTGAAPDQTNHPLVVGKNVYITVFMGPNDCRLYGFDGATGASLGAAFPRIVTTCGSMLDGTPATTSGAVYFKTNNELHAARAANGVPIVGFPLAITTPRYYQGGSPTADRGIVWIYDAGGETEKIYGFDAKTGAVLQAIYSGIFPNAWMEGASVPVAKGITYFGSCCGTATGTVAVDLDSGETVPGFSSNWFMGGKLVVANDLIYSPESLVLDARSGRLRRWLRPPEPQTGLYRYGDLAVSNGLLYATLNKEDGSEWIAGYLDAFEVPEAQRSIVGRSLVRAPSIADLRPASGAVPTTSDVDQVGRQEGGPSER